MMARFVVGVWIVFFLALFKGRRQGVKERPPEVVRGSV